MRTHRAECQPLERRVMLAGDVQVLIEAQILSVSGDDQANSLGIDFDPLGPAYVVTGREGTTINGSPGPLTLPTDLQGFNFNLGDGRDQLTVIGVNLPQADVFVSGGEGRDSVLIADSNFDAIGYDGGLGIDWIGLYTSDVNQFSGTGGGDRDTLEIRNISVAGRLFWNDRSGPGGLFMQDAQIDGDFEFASADTTATTEGPFNVWMELRDSTIGGNMGITTAGGDDRLFVRQVMVDARIIELDGGDDIIDDDFPL